MNYKDKTFEIDDNQIKFKNGIFVLFIIIFSSTLAFNFIYSKGSLISIASSIIGLVIAFYIMRMFIGFYLKNAIDLSDIDYVKAQIWDKSIDKNRNFWGTNRFKYHFPTGLNRKENPQVIFVHIKDRKAAVGFVPENYENVISSLKEKGIKIIS
ncbi:hypothetical protein [Ancylomarina sp. 16SWW S1-10-2]|uniref:hypothetical protein n=1 Tax=Ancylomarina sp. 16SWW S1-10-2 TaxID=2499681 RepID=UPI0012AE2587|nr:hypothetical protein [Ancylomarina sp. 16SWW S1-10-2]MRT92241.1 hypothetical protein [Ancylomarina sp. 16SWW S1-10-2]